jgi:hypothetical protein
VAVVNTDSGACGLNRVVDTGTTKVNKTTLVGDEELNLLVSGTRTRRTI